MKLTVVAIAQKEILGGRFVIAKNMWGSLFKISIL